MSTLPHGASTTADVKLINICLKAPLPFKIALDAALSVRQETVQNFCICAIAEKLGIPVPGEEPKPKRRSE